MLRTLLYISLIILTFTGCSSTNGPLLGSDEETLVVQAPQKIDYPALTKASYYANKFHGRKTASGIPYDHSAYTAAHRQLPLPSLVKVTNIDNDKSVLVVVNDRGPFKGQQTIDLSKKAAKDLGILRNGIADVKVEYLSKETQRFIPKITSKLNTQHKKTIHESMKKFAEEFNNKLSN